MQISSNGRMTSREQENRCKMWKNGSEFHQIWLIDFELDVLQRPIIVFFQGLATFTRDGGGEGFENPCTLKYS